MKAVIRKCCQELRADFADVFGTIIEILFIPIVITLFVIVDYLKVNIFFGVFSTLELLVDGVCAAEW